MYFCYSFEISHGIDLYVSDFFSVPILIPALNTRYYQEDFKNACLPSRIQFALWQKYKLLKSTNPNPSSGKSSIPSRAPWCPWAVLPAAWWPGGWGDPFLSVCQSPGSQALGAHWLSSTPRVKMSWTSPSTTTGRPTRARPRAKWPGPTLSSPSVASSLSSRTTICWWSWARRCSARSCSGWSWSRHSMGTSWPGRT